MTQWDYLRAFHARHPNLGALEPLYLRYFDAGMKARLAVKPDSGYRSETYFDTARRAAAELAERNTLEDYRAGRVRGVSR